MVLRHRPGAGGESAGEDGKTEAVRFGRAARIKCSESSFVETGKEQFMQSTLKMQKSVWFHTLLQTHLRVCWLLFNCPEDYEGCRISDSNAFNSSRDKAGT